MVRVLVCFVCCNLFTELDAERCPTCKWYKCPHCNNCLCSLTLREKIVAIAVWLSNADVPVEIFRDWLKHLKELKQIERL